MTTDRLARRFAAHMRYEFRGAERWKFTEMKRRNREVYNTTRGVCATHDFCDANMVMAAAFEEVYRRELDMDSDADLRLWAEAWDKAVARYLS